MRETRDQRHAAGAPAFKEEPYDAVVWRAGAR